MSEVQSAAVLGLGLIGGSLARDLAGAGVRVVGYDMDAESMRSAREAGVIPAGSAGTFADLETVDVVVLALPVLAAPALLRIIAPRLRNVPLVTDVGSTKASIVTAAQEVGLGERFVGSHPLAGDHRSGWTAARQGLFAGARVFLCPAPAATADAVGRAEALWRRVGAQPEAIDAAEHDRRLAWSSHLPQLVSSATAIALARAGIPPEELGPGGRDVTRLAGSSPLMWGDIAADNAAALGMAVAALREVLGEVERDLLAVNAEPLRRWFAAARAWAGDGEPGTPAA